MIVLCGLRCPFSLIAPCSSYYRFACSALLHCSTESHLFFDAVFGVNLNINTRYQTCVSFGSICIAKYDWAVSKNAVAAEARLFWLHMEERDYACLGSCHHHRDDDNAFNPTKLQLRLHRHQGQARAEGRLKHTAEDMADIFHPSRL